MPLKMLRVAVALAAVLAVVVTAQMSASAHDDKVFHGKDFALVTSHHTQVALCDEEKDGHAVFAYVRYGTAGLWAMENTNGADGNCVVKNFSNTVSSVKICEETKGCYEENV